MHSSNNANYISDESLSESSAPETSTSEESSFESEIDTKLNLWYIASFSHLNINLSTPILPTEPTFNSDEETYNYAINLINERKYYEAIKHLQKIPSYKDSTQLQMNLFSLIHQHFLVIDDKSSNVVAYGDMNTMLKLISLLWNIGQTLFTWIRARHTLIFIPIIALA